MEQDLETNSNDRVSTVSVGEAFWTWCRVAAFSFGGPAGQIAVMHRIIVDEKKWIREERFLHALNFCMLLPGPEAQQLATYIGWLMHGTPGALMAGGLFILPGFVSILVLSMIYSCSEYSLVTQAVFFGLKPAVLAVVLEAVIRIGRRVLKNAVMSTLAATSFVAIFFVGVPFPVLIVLAGVIGLMGGIISPSRFHILKERTGQELANTSTASDAEGQFVIRANASSSLRRAITVSIVCLTLWFGPLALVGFLLGFDSVYFQEGAFFSKAAVVTFGGAYSVLAYVAQEAVDKYGWLRPGEMLDGLGLAETTPGPLIMVVQFVAFLGAYRSPGPFSPMMGGLIASILTSWVTFVPCFFWILLGAPYIERLRGNTLVSAMLSAMTATVVGVILNLAVWFSLHTLFSEVTTLRQYGLSLLLPTPRSVNVAECVIAILAALLTFYWKAGMGLTLGVSTIVGAVWFLATSHS